MLKDVSTAPQSAAKGGRRRPARPMSAHSPRKGRLAQTPAPGGTDAPPPLRPLTPSGWPIRVETIPDDLFRIFTGHLNPGDLAVVFLDDGGKAGLLVDSLATDDMVSGAMAELHRIGILTNDGSIDRQSDTQEAAGWFDQTREVDGARFLALYRRAK